MGDTMSQQGVGGPARVQNLTPPGNHTQPLAWGVYLEGSILGLLCAVGILGNLLVLRTTVMMRNFAKRISLVFCSIGAADLLVCGVRLPLLLYGLLLPSWDSGLMACEVWHFSLALLAVVVWKNLFVGLQRIFIMHSLPKYRKRFTLKVTYTFVALTWMLSAALVHGVPRVVGIRFAYDDLVCRTSPDLGLVLGIFQSVIVGLLLLLPLVGTLVCYTVIVVKMQRAGLARIEGANYTRVMAIASFRVVVLGVTCLPLIFLYMTDVVVGLVPSQLARYIEYCICLQSVVSPFITLQDSAFRYKATRRKLALQYCISARCGSSKISCSEASKRRTRRFRRSRKGQSVVTSAEMRTFKHTE